MEGIELGVMLENEAAEDNLFKAVEKRIFRQGKDVNGNSSMKDI